MLQAFATPHNRILSVLLLVACGLLAAGAALLGISDNPPGILLAFLSVSAFVTAFVHPWRSARAFWSLARGSLGAIAVFVLLCALFDTLAKRLGAFGLLAGLLHVLYGASLLGVMVCPSAFVVGAVGGLVMHARARPRSNTAA